MPKITGVSPTGGNVGVEIKITGSNFDPNATVQLGGGSVKPLGFKGAGTASVWIATNDTNGNLVINNQCANTTATFNDFRKINLSIGKVMINQGYGAMGLLANRATLVSAFIIKDQQERPSDKLQVDNLAVSVVRTSDLAAISDRTIPVAAGFPAALGSFPPGFTNDISQSLNMPLVLLAPGNMRVDVRLTNRAAQVASATSFVDVARNYDLNVLLVPIVPDGFSPDQMNALKSKVDRALSEPNLRLMPSGGIFATWSRDVMVTDPVNIGSDNYLTGLRKYAIEMDRIRQRTNSGYGFQYGIVLGIVAEGHNTSGTPGASFRPETSADANFWLGIPDLLCDFGNDIVHSISLGLLGSDDGCHMDYPMHVGWVEAKDGPDSATQDTLGRVMAHEAWGTSLTWWTTRPATMTRATKVTRGTTRLATGRAAQRVRAGSVTDVDPGRQYRRAGGQPDARHAVAAD